MIKKNWLVKALSLAMAIMMVVGIMAPAVSAAIVEDRGNEKGTLNYVSIGDSMTNGFGFDGYKQNDETSEDYNFLTGEGVYGDRSYANQFADYLADKFGVNVDHKKLAPSGLVAHDVLYLLGGIDTPVNDGWDGYEDYVGSASVDELKALYLDAVTNADIITLGLGNATFGAYMVNMITNAVGVMGEPGNPNRDLTLENGLALLENEEARALVLEVYNSMKEELFALELPEELEAFNVEAILDILAFTVAEFLLSYEAVLDKIVELKPDVEIVLVGVMNTTYGMTVKGENFEFAFGDMMDEAFKLLNAYIAGLPTYKQLSGEYATRESYYVNVETGERIELPKELAAYLGQEIVLKNVKLEKVVNDNAPVFYYAEFSSPEFIVQKFDDLFANGWQSIDDLDGQLVRQKQIESYNGGLRYIIAGALGFNLPAITLDQVNRYSASADAKEYGYDFYLTSVEAPAIAGGFNTPTDFWGGEVQRECKAAIDAGNYGALGGIITEHIEIEISIAIYLALEEAVARSVDTMDVNVEGLMGISGNPLDALGAFPEELNSNPAPMEIKDILADWFTGSATGLAMCKVYAFFKVGNGLSVHPTPAAHDELAKSVIAAYENGYTAQRETLNNVLAVLGVVKDVIIEICCDAYADAYKDAVADGYIAEAVDAIDTAMNAISELDLDVLGVTDELKAAIEAELAATLATLDEIKNVLANNKAETVEGLVASVSELEDDLYAHLTSIENIVLQAGADIDAAYILPVIAYIKDTVLATVDSTVKTVYEETYAYVVSKIEMAYGIALDVVIDFNASVESVIADITAQVYKQLAKVYRVYDLVLAIAQQIKETLTIDNLISIVREYIGMANAELESIIGGIVDNIIGNITDNITDKKEQVEDVLEDIREGLIDKNEQVVDFYGVIVDALNECAENGVESVEGIIDSIEKHAADKTVEVQELCVAVVASLEKQYYLTVEEIAADIEAQITKLSKEAQALYADVVMTLEDAGHSVEELVALVVDTSKDAAAKYKEFVSIVVDVRNVVLGVSKEQMDVISVIFEAIKSGAATTEEIIVALRYGFANAFAGEITVDEDFLLVAIGEDLDYVEYVAKALHLTSDQYVKASVSDVTDELIAKADLIVVEYDDRSAVDFATEQLLGVANGYFTYTKEFIAAIINKLGSVPMFSNFDIKEMLETELSKIDEYNMIASAVEGKEAVELDWASLIGEENLGLVDALRKEVYTKLSEEGKLETVSVSIDVADAVNELLAKYSEGIFKIEKDILTEKLGEHSVYTIEIDLAEVATLVVESALYEYIRYNTEYSETVNAIAALNSDAAIALLGNYSRYGSFGYDIVIGEVTITLDDILGYTDVDTSYVPDKALGTGISEVITVEQIIAVASYGSTISPLANAVAIENAFVVDLSGAANGGAEYIASKIISALTVKGHITDHVWEEVSRTEGDCSNLVQIIEKCNICGEVRVLDGVYGTHTEVVLPAKDATCTETGLTEGKMCSICGEIFVPQEEIAKTAHAEVILPGVSATCTETGLTEGKKCDICGEVFVPQKEIAKTAHAEVVIPGIDAMCIRTGLTEGKKCSTCGEVLVAQEEIDFAPHTEIIVPGKDATCTEAGLTEGKKCSVCDLVIVERTETDAKGHTEEAIPAVEPTYSKAGATEGVKCSECGEILEAPQVIPAKSLAWLWVTIASVAVLGGAAVGVFFFVIKKKI